MAAVSKYLSLVKFSHTIFAMPFALIGFALGYRSLRLESGTTDVYILSLKLTMVVACMVFARSAAMAFNRYLDRAIDARNPRTAARELPSGVLSTKQVLGFTIFNSIAFVLCAWFINRLCFLLSPIALFIILFYSYTKRFTALCHLVLGLGLSLAPIGAYLAVRGEFDWLPLLFSFSVLSWVSGFDIIYALQDEEFDKKESLHSIPAMIGKKRALRVSELLHVITFGCILAAGLYSQAGSIYWSGMAAFSAMLLYQHIIVKPEDLSRVNLAFMTTNGIASVVFAFFTILDLSWHQF
jgi:4-hydroxybenzoate polyprenyltransferase